MRRSVQDVMTTRVVSVLPDAPVSRAVDLMRRYGFSALPVANARYHLVGMISLLDVIRLREDQPSTADDAKVEEIMTPDPLSMAPSAKLAFVAHRMLSYGELRVMPIVKRRELVGVVTRSDLLRPPPPRRGLIDRALDWAQGRGDDDDERLDRLARPKRDGPPAPDDAPVSRVMASDVVTVGRGDAISTAVELLLRHRYTALPVVEPDGRLVGLMSEADALGSGRPRGDPLFSQTTHPKTVGAVMTTAPVTIDASGTVGDARSIIADRGIRLLPVVDDVTLVGVVARSNLV
jgi:CBS domain-containing protein